MSKKLREQQKLIEALLPTSPVRNSPPGPLRAMEIQRQTNVSDSALDRSGIANRRTLGRAKKRIAKGFDPCRDGGQRKLCDDDELLLEAMIINARMNGYVVTPTAINEMVCYSPFLSLFINLF